MSDIYLEIGNPSIKNITADVNSVLTNIIQTDPTALIVSGVSAISLVQIEGAQQIDAEAGSVLVGDNLYLTASPIPSPGLIQLSTGEVINVVVSTGAPAAHNHDGVYALIDHIHEGSANLGTKSVDETDIADNRILVYKELTNNLVYEDKPTGTGTGTGNSYFPAGW